MKLNRLGERFYVYPYQERGDRPNLYYIKGDGFSVAIDAGNSSFHVKGFYDALKEEGLPLPDCTIISHWHWDHTFGLDYIHGTSISSRNCHDKFIEVSKWKWTLEDMKEREKTGEDIPFCTENILLEYPNLNDIKVITTDEILDNDLTLHMGGMTIQVLPRVSTHSDDALYVYIPEEKALIVEDADCEDFYNGSVYDHEKLSDMIAFFESMDYEYHYLGHAERETKQFALDRLHAELNKL